MNNGKHDQVASLRAKLEKAQKARLELEAQAKDLAKIAKANYKSHARIAKILAALNQAKLLSNAEYHRLLSSVGHADLK